MSKRVANKFKSKVQQGAKFVRSNWKELLAIGGLITIGSLIASKSNSNGDSNSQRGSYGMKLSNKWFGNAPEDEINAAREEIRTREIADNDIRGANQQYDELKWFDRKLATLRDVADDSDAEPVRREHGWYLSNDD